MRTHLILLLLLTGLNGMPASWAAGSFNVREYKVQAPEMGTITCYILRVGSEEFSFMPPRDWRMGVEADRHRVVFQSPDGSSSMCIVVSPREQGSDPEPDALRQAVSRQFSQGRIAEEFPSYTGSHQGRGYQVQWIGGGQVPMLSRVAVFSTPTATLEFTLTTMANRFQTVQPVLGALMTSFQKKVSVENEGARPGAVSTARR